MSVDNPGAPSSTSPSTAVEEQARQDASGASHRLREDLDAVSQQAAEDARKLKGEVAAQAGAAADKAKSFASDQKDYAAGQITGVASAIGKVADELEGDQATTARYARDLATNLEKFGKTVEGKSVDDLMGMAQQFGRTQPLAFLGAAALAGFVASRFAMASAQRVSQPASGAQTGTTPGTSSYSGSSYGQNAPQPSYSGNTYGSGSSSTTTGNGTGYTGGGNVAG
jgi:hypothetical protein